MSAGETFDPYGKVSMGTTLFALKFKDGVVLGADSRTSSGVYVSNRVSNKLTQVADRIFCCRSGSAADTQAVARFATQYLNLHSVERGEEPYVKTAARLFQHLCYNNRDALSAGIIVAGWDKLEKGSVYNIPLGGSKIKSDYALAGSGSTFMYGWVDENWKPDMSKDEAVAFVRQGIAHAIARDGSSGGLIRTVVITEEGCEDATIDWNNLPYRLETDSRLQTLLNPTKPIEVGA
eukprot:NODE_3620_length_945_cov_21.882812_g3325_i0.p1 GENE.NODE_3620_length_945_cov_21.882812_g3325_i0~~NODE_3620_length_945_cov_21.882812_g3325_i0.p1  ORF type:complete len:252 (+),score=53.28 NODE_3620_length_945_cov_21.882812_g3325_i0:54-758(+)